MKISIFGTGYVGLTTGACLANLGHDVLCMDINEKKIKSLKTGEIPFFEPGLEDLVLKNIHKKRLDFTTSVLNAVNFGEVIFNCVGTPSNKDSSAYLGYVWEVAEKIGRNMRDYKVIVNKSTVPPGTSRRLQQVVKFSQVQEVDFDVVSNPEFLKEGTAIRSFINPDKIVLGVESDRALHVMRKVYSGRMRTYLPILETDWETAELIKYANNTFLATKISFINEMANICDKVGADVKMVSQAIGMDYRISPRFLNAGVGYGGSCFPKDVKALISTAKKHGYTPQLFEAVDSVNKKQPYVFLDQIRTTFADDLKDKTLCILGLSFKPGTSDVRESPSLKIVKQLICEGAKLNVYDPVAKDEFAKLILPGPSNLKYCNSVEESVQGSEAIILLTEWDEFRNLDFTNLRKIMKGNKFFDGRNVYDTEFVSEEGFEYHGIGRK